MRCLQLIVIIMLMKHKLLLLISAVHPVCVSGKCEHTPGIVVSKLVNQQLSMLELFIGGGYCQHCLDWEI